ncbi:hypothetical protein [Mycobacterium sp.]|uniref:hypothetical protein n=1 Tax=Mycobacterium sp. TaxID=1785 RepID=UPI002CBB4C86|nr:hypothetical protein [Mycobacterium sp.]HME47502.1 hypothetical protein [Mycobacterium sp.]
MAESTEKQTVVERAADLSEEVLKSVESGQRAAIDAVRKFVGTVDEAIPARGDRPSGNKTIVDAALEMADKLVETQHEFVRSVINSASETLKKQGAAKPAAEAPAKPAAKGAAKPAAD